MESRINHFPVLFPCLNLVCIMQIVYNCKGVYVICRRNEMGKFIKRLIAAALTLIMTLLLPAVSVNAEPQQGTGNTASAGETELSDFEKQRKASYDTVPETNSIDGWPEGPKVYGNSAIVMDMDSGQASRELAYARKETDASISNKEACFGLLSEIQTLLEKRAKSGNREMKDHYSYLAFEIRQATGKTE